MDYCPVCGGHLGGSAACPACGSPAQPLPADASVGHHDPYADGWFDAQGHAHPQQQYAQFPQHYAQPQYEFAVAGAAYGGPPAHQEYPAQYGVDPMTVGWHSPVPPNDPHGYGAGDAARPYDAFVPEVGPAPAPATAPYDAVDPVHPLPTGPDPYATEPPDEEPYPAEARADEGPKDRTHERPEDEWDEGAGGFDDPEACGRPHGRRGRPRRRTMKLVVGTATGLVLAGGLAGTVSGGFSPPGTNSAQDDPAQAGGAPGDGSGLPSAPVNAVPVLAQDPDAPGAAPRDASAHPSSSVSASASATEDDTSPSATPRHGSTPPAAAHTAAPPTSPPAPPTYTQPPQHRPPHQGHTCVLLCWG